MSEFQVVGGCHFDERLVVDDLYPGQSTPTVSFKTLGGVAFNVAKALQSKSVPVATHFICGDDVEGQALNLALRSTGFKDAQRLNGRSPRYLAIENQSGQLLYGLADMSLYDAMQLDFKPNKLVMDTNPPVAFFEALAKSQLKELHVVVTSPAKVKRLLPIVDKLDSLFLNLDEARSLLDFDETKHFRDVKSGLIELGLKTFVLTNESNPVTIFQGGQLKKSNRPEPLPNNKPQTGLGDRFAGLTLAALYNQKQTLLTACNQALKDVVC